MWIDKAGGTKQDSWIDLIWVTDDDHSTWWTECSVKWDGCIHYSDAVNIPFEKGLDSNSGKIRDEKGACDCYIHICEIDDMIKKLIELRKVAQAHFKDSEEWNDKS